MNQRAANGQVGGVIRLDTVVAWLPRLVPVIVVFAIAFGVDMATGQRYSSVWGSIAIVASAVAVFPAARPALVATGIFGGIWLAFNLVRAVADNAGLAFASPGTAAGWERGLFGTLPSAWVQERLFNPGRARVLDVALSIVHGSFFVMPFVVAAVLWWRQPSLFRRYALATAATFALGLVGFLLLPTAPPWLAESGTVTRITHHLLEESSGVSLSYASGESGFWFEPNDLAALPSIHVAATVLILLAARHLGRTAGVLASIYALLMTFAVVYLGEHYLIDALLGWVVAGAGWWLAGRLTTGRDVTPTACYRASTSPGSSSNQARPG